MIQEMLPLMPEIINGRSTQRYLRLCTSVETFGEVDDKALTLLAELGVVLQL
jgi:hypothetical protein